MGVASGITLSVNALPGWRIFFAKEPAPAGDAGQAPDMDKTVVLGPPGKKGPTPPSSKERLLFLLLVLVIAGAGGYLAMNPDFLANLLGDAPGEVPPAPPPKVAKPATPPPAPAQPAAAPAAPAPTPAPATPMAAPAPAVPAPAPTPVPAVPVAPPVPAAPATAPKPVTPAPAAVASVPVTTAPAAAKPPAPAVVASIPAPVAPAPHVAIPSPRFHEGQKVFVGAPIRLTADSAGTKQGPATAKPGSALKVLDADLLNNAWVYSVRTQQGATGWIAEKNLRAKK